MINCVGAYNNIVKQYIFLYYFTFYLVSQRKKVFVEPIITSLYKLRFLEFERKRHNLYHQLIVILHDKWK